MKKILACLFFTIFLCTISACGPMFQTPLMYIEPAVLTSDEERFAELLGAKKNIIFDFQLDDRIQAIGVNTYVLTDGQWQLISGGGGQQFTDPKGRIALDFAYIEEGLRIAVQSEHSSSATSYRTEASEAFSGSCTTSTLQERTAIAYEEELPLALQIMTADNTVHAYKVSSFFTPEQYADQPNARIYAITISFSQKAVREQVHHTMK